MPSTQQQAAYLFNKNLGVGKAKATTTLIDEFGHKYPSFKSQVDESRIKKDPVPDVVPHDLRLDKLDTDDALYVPLSELLDDFGQSLSGSLCGLTSSLSNVVRRYDKVPLTAVPNSQVGSVPRELGGNTSTEYVYQMFQPIRDFQTSATPFGFASSHPNVLYTPSRRSGDVLKTTASASSGATTITVDDVSFLLTGTGEFLGTDACKVYVRDLSGCIAHGPNANEPRHHVTGVNQYTNEITISQQTSNSIAVGATIVVWMRTSRVVKATIGVDNNVVSIADVDASGVPIPYVNFFGRSQHIAVGDVVALPIGQRSDAQLGYVPPWRPYLVAELGPGTHQFKITAEDTDTYLSAQATAFDIEIFESAAGAPFATVEKGVARFGTSGQEFSDVGMGMIDPLTDQGSDVTYKNALFRFDAASGLPITVPAGPDYGDWLFDIDSGTCRAYSGAKLLNPTNNSMTGNRPAAHSYFRYVGEYGVGGNEILFDGGLDAAEEGSDGFDIKAIQIDSRNLGTIEQYSQALQFGGNGLGAWRIVVRNQLDDGMASTGDGDTSFHIQTYRSGAWVDMQVIVQE